MRGQLLMICVAMALSAQAAEAATVHTFVSPDSSFDAAAGFIEDSSESIQLATYTFDSPEIAEMLAGKASLGVRTEVMVEKSPAGGVGETEKELLCMMSSAGVDVRMYDGALSYMHAKYMVSDGSSVLVTSENFGHGGFCPDGSYGNRGWGAIVIDQKTASMFSAAFSEDMADSTAFECETEGGPGGGWTDQGAYEPSHAMGTFAGQDVEFVSSPDSLDELLEMIGEAEESIMVEQFYIYTHWGSPTYDTVESSPSPLIEALAEKAREGVEVRVLLDSTYYNMDKEKSTSNYNTIVLLNCMAENESLPMTAAAVNPDVQGIAKVHNKGAIVDGRLALASSINWNENSVMNNRETGVLIGGDAAGYYASVFEEDWEGATIIACNGSLRKIETASADCPSESPGFFAAMLSLSALCGAVIYFTKRKI